MNRSCRPQPALCRAAWSRCQTSCSSTAKSITLEMTPSSVIEASDCLIVVGCKLKEIATKRFQLFHGDRPIIHIEALPEEIGRTTRTDYPLLGDARLALEDLNGEGFRVPAGVRKPLMQEPAGHSRWLWGFRSAADVGVSATDAGKRGRGCRPGASLRPSAVWPAPQVARREPVDDDRHHRRARVRCRRLGAFG